MIEQDTTINISWQQAVLQARKYLPFAEEFYPQYVEELRGIAEGSGADFDDILTLNTMEAITSDALFLKCTSLAVGSEVTESGAGVIVAHNEDWMPADKPFVYVAQIEPDDEPAFLALSYGALLPNLGFNTAGIAHVADSVYPNDVRLGIPRIIYTRAILGARTLGQAIQAAIHRRRDAGYNHLIAGEHGEIYSIEASATAYDALYADEHWTAHTNHYTSAGHAQLRRKAGSVGQQPRALQSRTPPGQRPPGQADRRRLSDHPGRPHQLSQQHLRARRDSATRRSIARSPSLRSSWTWPRGRCGSAGAIRARGRTIRIG